MELKTGYKATDVGVIPFDWDVCTVADVVASFQNGFAFASHGYVKSGVPIVTMAQIGLDGFFNFQPDAVNYWPSKAASTLVDFHVVSGDIIVAMTDVTPQKNLIGRMVQVTEKGPLLLNQRVGLLRVSVEKIDPYFLHAISNSSGWRTYARSVASLGVQANISTTDILSGKLALPPLEEQRAIATALFDVDALIAGLEKLIAKKRDLKQAAMQQLLTGQTRLPGFSGEWVKRTLGEIGEISGAGVDKKIRFGEQPVRLLNYMDVYKRTFLKSSDFSHEVSAKPDQIRRCSVKAGDVFFTPTSEVREDIGHSAVALEDMPDVVYSYHVVRLRLFDGWDPTFSAYPFQTKSFLDQASTTCEGSGTRYVITLPKFRALEVLYPADKREQAAIASVLFDMDAEIVALETRLAKTRELKQGMMQELLTGRIRLV